MMVNISAYLLVNQRKPSVIRVGDEIKIHEAYSQKNWRIGFVRFCEINGTNIKTPIAESYTRHLERISPVQGKISRVLKDGEDLIIDVEAVEEEGLG